MFDIRLSQEQREFRDLARKFAQEEIKLKAMVLDREPEWEKRVPWDLIRLGHPWVSLHLQLYPKEDVS